MVTQYSNCYQCGGQDHFARDCPARGPERPQAGMPPGYNVGVPPRLVSEAEAARCALAGASAIREAYGWQRSSGGEGRSRNRALEQVAEARAARLAEHPLD